MNSGFYQFTGIRSIQGCPPRLMRQPPFYGFPPGQPPPLFMSFPSPPLMQNWNGYLQGYPPVAPPGFPSGSDPWSLDFNTSPVMSGPPSAGDSASQTSLTSSIPSGRSSSMVLTSQGVTKQSSSSTPTLQSVAMVETSSKNTSSDSLKTTKSLKSSVINIGSTSCSSQDVRLLGPRMVNAVSKGSVAGFTVSSNSGRNISPSKCTWFEKNTPATTTVSVSNGAGISTVQTASSAGSSLASSSVYRPKSPASSSSTMVTLTSRASTSNAKTVTVSAKNPTVTSPSASKTASDVLWSAVPKTSRAKVNVATTTSASVTFASATFKPEQKTSNIAVSEALSSSVASSSAQTGGTTTSSSLSISAQDFFPSASRILPGNEASANAPSWSSHVTLPSSTDHWVTSLRKSDPDLNNNDSDCCSVILPEAACTSSSSGSRIEDSLSLVNGMASITLHPDSKSSAGISSLVVSEPVISLRPSPKSLSAAVRRTAVSSSSPLSFEFSLADAAAQCVLLSTDDRAVQCTPETAEAATMTEVPAPASTSSSVAAANVDELDSIYSQFIRNKNIDSEVKARCASEMDEIREQTSTIANRRKKLCDCMILLVDTKETNENSPGPRSCEKKTMDEVASSMLPKSSSSSATSTSGVAVVSLSEHSVRCGVGLAVGEGRKKSIGRGLLHERVRQHNVPVEISRPGLSLSEPTSSLSSTSITSSFSGVFPTGGASQTDQFAFGRSQMNGFLGQGAPLNTAANGADFMPSARTYNETFLNGPTTDHFAAAVSIAPLNSGFGSVNNSNRFLPFPNSPPASEVLDAGMREMGSQLMTNSQSDTAAATMMDEVYMSDEETEPKSPFRPMNALVFPAAPNPMSFIPGPPPAGMMFPPVPPTCNIDGSFGPPLMQFGIGSQLTLATDLAMVDSVLRQNLALTEHVSQLILQQHPLLAANPLGLRFATYRELLLLRHVQREQTAAPVGLAVPPPGASASSVRVEPPPGDVAQGFTASGFDTEPSSISPAQSSVGSSWQAATDRLEKQPKQPYSQALSSGWRGNTPQYDERNDSTRDRCPNANAAANSEPSPITASLDGHGSADNSSWSSAAGRQSTPPVRSYEASVKALDSFNLSAPKASMKRREQQTDSTGNQDGNAERCNGGRSSNSSRSGDRDIDDGDWQQVARKKQRSTQPWNSNNSNNNNNTNNCRTITNSKRQRGRRFK